MKLFFFLSIYYKLTSKIWSAAQKISSRWTPKNAIKLFTHIFQNSLLFFSLPSLLSASVFKTLMMSPFPIVLGLSGCFLLTSQHRLLFHNTKDSGGERAAEGFCHRIACSSCCLFCIFFIFSLSLVAIVCSTVVYRPSFKLVRRVREAVRKVFAT